MLRAVGLLMLFSGVALVTHILSGVSLLGGLVAAAAVLVLGLAVAWRTASRERRARLAVLIKVGAVSGMLATVAYDATKWLLTRIETPYNPFEAIAVFGRLLLGPSAGVMQRLLAGAAFHLLNGISFGVAFCFLFGGRGVLVGVGWGLFLEMFQLTLYPGWLDVRFYREFLQVSFLAHVVYGAVLARCCQSGLRRGRLPRAGPALQP